MTCVAQNKKNTNKEQARWDRARVMAFWDRPRLTLDVCRKKIYNNDKRTIMQCMLYMTADDFVFVTGSSYFSHHYPQWQAWFDEIEENTRVIHQRTALNVKWSLINCNTIFVKKPTMEWFALTKKQRETFFAISNHGFVPVYQIAKAMNRNYRRTWADVHALIKKGLISSVKKLVNGKQALIVFV